MKNQLSGDQIKSIAETGRDFSDATIFLHEAVASKAGLSGADHKYLGLLIKHGAMTAGEFAKLTGLTTGAITGLVDRLEKKKLVERVFDKTDRRKVMIAPNHTAITELLEPLFAHLQARVINLIAQQTEAELDAVTKYMQASIAMMKEVTEELKNQK